MEEQKTSGIPLTGFLVVEKTVAEDGYVAALMVTINLALVSGRITRAAGHNHAKPHAHKD